MHVRPADDHRCDDGFPTRVEKLSASWMFRRDDHPHWSQAQEKGTDQV